MALWQGLRASLEAELAEPRSRLRQGLSGLLRSLGTTIAEDTAVQARMDARIEEVVLALMEPWRKGAGQFVADVVRGWESRTVVDRVELAVGRDLQRSEEHTSELQSLMRISYAVFCLKNKIIQNH